MENSEILYYLALQATEGIGDINAKKLISHCGSAEAVIKEIPKNLEKISGIGAYTIKGLKNTSLIQKAEKELEYINNNDIQAFTFLDENYPNNLKHCIDAPILLFQKGKINLKHQRIISIVGTRMITNYGKSFLEEFISEVKEYNPIIVSGLAYGIDIYAHQQAIKNNLQTIAVLAHGLDVVYPKRHKKEALKMQEDGGLFSEFWSNTNPDRENFVKRNRIVAGVSQATIVVESAEKGGSLITAGIANSYNRDVFAVPGRTSDKFSKGCNQLIKTNQAALINSVKDLAYMLNWETEDKKLKKLIQKQLFVELNEYEETIYNLLLKEGKQNLDFIALNCKYPIHKTATVLLNLELKGLIKPLPGKIFEAV
ncbi:MAG: DNA-processing protein DprA [Flavobacteriaceae bacterium]|nr:DNA-processing protein DprA [Flavobacteriaceae bacterium]